MRGRLTAAAKQGMFAKAAASAHLELASGANGSRPIHVLSGVERGRGQRGSKSQFVCDSGCVVDRALFRIDEA